MLRIVKWLAEAAQGLLKALIGLLIFLFMVALMLRYLDPLGAYRYFTDLTIMSGGYVASERGYSMYPGLYQFSNWTALIERSGNRHTPAAHDSACEIVFMGDSVTFGFGVNDDETFVNLIAAQLDARVSNTGITLYNSENVRRVLETYEADGYIYFLNPNDGEPTRVYGNTLPFVPRINSSLDHVVQMNVSAWRDLQATYAALPLDEPRFAEDMAVLLARDDVLIATFIEPRGWDKRLPDSVVRVPMWTHNNSAVDTHPNAEGHAEIAAALLPYAWAFEDRICGE